ncbi:DNA-binding TFAR19-related protein [Sanghuangporus baumii]|uniref:DNA-binding TFAR19-related protein n=1 Tax=Sanghuangporus baumii TaxID=108892 RepID=A0A9Q5I0Z9_SANBA|nr:DNA-binding TFAR19-related protein [Sanghuangporus baumii]
MDDQELAAIRAARLQQLRQNASPGSGSPLPQGLPTGGPGAGDPEAEAKRADEEQMRRDLLATVLDTKARERRKLISLFVWFDDLVCLMSDWRYIAVARIALVSPARSSQIEAILLRMAQTGQLRGRVGEEQLIGLLEQAEDAQAKSGAKKGAIVYQRRKELDDDDGFDFDL